jgi:hypothetical protein
MNYVAAPYFVHPHRFDQPGQAAPTHPDVDGRHQIVLEPGERVLWRGRTEVAGYLLGPSPGHPTLHWSLLRPASVTVTDRRLALVCEYRGFEEVRHGAALRRARHRRRPPHLGDRVVAGQVRWQWPARLHLLPAATGAAGATGAAAATGAAGAPEHRERILLVCDSLRSTARPGLALGAGDLGGPGAARELIHVIRRAIARFRLDSPGTPELTPVHRDALTVRAGAGLWADELAEPQRGIDLPGAMVVEFTHRDDYHRSTTRGFSLARWALQATAAGLWRAGQPGSAS